MGFLLSEAGVPMEEALLFDKEMQTRMLRSKNLPLPAGKLPSVSVCLGECHKRIYAFWYGKTV
jgi:hypothetical protein